MSAKSASPYLILHGKAKEALTLYERALGAQGGLVRRFGDVDQSCSTAQKDLVMHAELRIGQAFLMLSDGPVQATSVPEARVSVALLYEDEGAARQAFDGLAQGGQVSHPFSPAPWGGMFGSLHDAFGISWMFTYMPAPA